MPLKSSRPERSGTAPLARPFLHALTRMQGRAVARPEELVERASALLVESFGPSTSPTEAAFSHGVLGVASEHTHYFNGFAVLLPVSHGSAVAARMSEDDTVRCAVETGEPFLLSAADPDPRRALLNRLVGEMASPGSGVQLAVVSTIPDWWGEVEATALGVAAARALQALYARSDDSLRLMRSVHAAIQDALDLPFSIAYPLAADDGRPGCPVLVDTETHEHLMLTGSDYDEVGWGAVHVDTDQDHLPAEVGHRVGRAAEALEILQRGGFPKLTSYRELEHRDLERALEILPASHAPVVRYLVSENRRVQKLVGAVRRRDWQMMGALMLMSHAAQRDDWKLTSRAEDHVVDRAEAMSLEGVYGARTSGRSGTVLIAGQPFVIPDFLDRMQPELQEQFQTSSHAILL